MNFKITPFLLFFVILIVLSLSMVIGNVSFKEGLETSPPANIISTRPPYEPAPTTTAAPTTKAPTTAAPTTKAPTTVAPTTSATTTAVPTTKAPTTVAPTTSATTTAVPTTKAPTTAAPTTSAPTTAAPTTSAPTTAAPTTSAPTTAAPTTSASTTSAPTTVAPTTPGCKNVVPEELKCGDDMACKWYWYFKKRDLSGNQYLTEDYLLKTQIVPPVCPSCPSCPSTGVCTNCGGNGGSGTTGSTTSKDSSGNKYVLNKSSIVGTDAAGNIILDTPKNMTVADYYGNYATTADPDTIGGGLTISGLAFGAGFQGIARDVVDITTDTTSKLGKGLEYVGGGVGNAASGVGKFVDKAATGVGGFVDKAATGVGGFVDKTVSGVGGFVGNTLDSTGRLITDTSGRLVVNNNQGGSNIGYGNAYNSKYSGDNNRNNTGYLGNQPGGSVYQSGNVGKVDNYSYYGALQSKGSNYMPVTSDFSKFGR